MNYLSNPTVFQRYTGPSSLAFVSDRTARELPIVDMHWHMTVDVVPKFSLSSFPNHTYLSYKTSYSLFSLSLTVFLSSLSILICKGLCGFSQTCHVKLTLIGAASVSVVLDLIDQAVFINTAISQCYSKSHPNQLVLSVLGMTETIIAITHRLTNE
ncbi:hypothetical protein EDD85DRAFT_388308 [Armillaria nabsnona]|nr:hypothetical protein EDD85DRAFT_388308 [Armillaria nabsnona]